GPRYSLGRGAGVARQRPLGARRAWRRPGRRGAGPRLGDDPANRLGGGHHRVGDAGRLAAQGPPVAREPEPADGAPPRPAAAPEPLAALGSARARSLGWPPRPGESLALREARRVIVPAVTLGADDQVLRGEATRLARSWLQSRSGLDEDVLEPVLRVAATHGDS